MSKIEFLWKLQNALRWSFSQEEIADILRDYESFFVSGSEEGKTEEDICKNLGNPSVIAQDLTESLGKKKMRPLSARIIKRMALSTALLLISLAYYFAVYESTHIVRDSIIMFTGFSVVLWLVLGGTFRGAPPVSYVMNASRKWLLPMVHVLLISMVAIFFFLIRILERELLSGVDILSYANIVINLRTVFVIIAFMMGAFSIYGFYRFSTYFFTITTHALGVVAYLSAAYNIMSQLTTASTFFNNIMLLFVVYGISVAFTFLFGFFVRATSRKGIK